MSYKIVTGKFKKMVQPTYPFRKKADRSNRIVEVTETTDDTNLVVTKPLKKYLQLTIDTKLTSLPNIRQVVDKATSKVTELSRLIVIGLKK